MNAVHVKALDDGRFFSVLNGNNQGVAIATFGLKSDGENPFYRSKLTCKSQLTGQTKRFKIRNSVVSLQFQQTKRNRKVKTRSLLSYIGRRKVDGYSLAARPSQSAVADGGCDAIFAFLYGGVRKSNHCDLVRVTPFGLGFN